MQAEVRRLAAELDAAKTGHQAEMAHVLAQLQDSEAQLLGRVSQLGRQLAAARQEVASKEAQLEATGSALDQVR